MRVHDPRPATDADEPPLAELPEPPTDASPTLPRPSDDQHQPAVPG